MFYVYTTRLLVKAPHFYISYPRLFDVFVTSRSRDRPVTSRPLPLFVHKIEQEKQMSVVACRSLRRDEAVDGVYGI